LMCNYDLLVVVVRSFRVIDNFCNRLLAFLYKTTACLDVATSGD